MTDGFRPFLMIDGSKPGITIGTLIDDRSAFGQWQLSHQYCQAARILVGAREERPNVLLPTYFMICHGAELALKAFLLTSGRTLAELAKPPLNHDLKLLLETATAAGLEVEPKATETLRSLADAATNFYFRYGAKDAGSIEQAVAVHVPPVEDSMSAIESISNAVHSAVRG